VDVVWHYFKAQYLYALLLCYYMEDVFKKCRWSLLVNIPSSVAACETVSVGIQTRLSVTSLVILEKNRNALGLDIIIPGIFGVGIEIGIRVRKARVRIGGFRFQ